METEKKAPANQESAGKQAETFWEKYKRRRQQKKENEKKKTVGQEILSWVLTILSALVIAMLIRMYIAEPIKVDGDSMNNTLHDKDIVLVAKLPYLLGDMQRNDIVICRYPGRVDGTFNFGASLGLTQYTIFVKRLVALPGDTVQIYGGKLYVNGELVPDPENMGSVPRDYGPRVLGADEYFVMGDNRYTSHDSRASDVGPISASAIMGKVTRVLLPWRSVE